MPLPTNKTAPEFMKEPQTNLYAETTKPGYRHHMVVPMLQKTEDGKELHLPMVVLTTREQNEVEIKAYQATRAAFGGVVPKNDEPNNWDRILDDNRATLTIFYATRLPDDLTKKWFNDKTQVEDTYTPEEAGILCNNYLSVKLTQPHLKHFDANNADAFQAIIDRIKKDGESDFFLNGFTTHSVNQLVKFLVSQLPSLPKDNG